MDDDIFAKYVYTYGCKMFPHRIKIERQNEGFYLGINEWIEKNIRGTWTDIHNSRGYFVEFELEEDAVAFKLRWI